MRSPGSSTSARFENVRLPVTVTSADRFRRKTASTVRVTPRSTLMPVRLTRAKLGSEISTVYTPSCKAENSNCPCKSVTVVAAGSLPDRVQINCCAGRRAPVWSVTVPRRSRPTVCARPQPGLTDQTGDEHEDEAIHDNSKEPKAASIFRRTGGPNLLPFRQR